MTPTQKQIFDFIVAFRAERGYSRKSMRFSSVNMFPVEKWFKSLWRRPQLSCAEDAENLYRCAK